MSTSAVDPLKFVYVLAALCLGVLLANQLWQKFRSDSERAANRAATLFCEVRALLQFPNIQKSETAGTWIIEGEYKDRFFQLKVLADLLSTRKLPTLWLMVTRPAAQPLAHTLDLMMRPAGPTTFSNFDFLPHTLATPAGFPAHAALRSDAIKAPLSLEKVALHLKLFESLVGKELLISPKGLRIVVLLAQADRARYGVLRQADFGNFAISAALAKDVLDSLLALEDDIADDQQKGNDP